MSPVTEKKMTPEEREAANQDFKDRFQKAKDSVVDDDFVKSLNYPPGVKVTDEGSTEAPKKGRVGSRVTVINDAPEEEAEGTEETEEPESEETEEEGEEPEGEETEEGEESEEEAGEEETGEEEEKGVPKRPDDLVSRAKVQKRINQLVAEKKRLEAENAKLREQTQAEEADPDMAKLRKLDDTNLKVTLRNVLAAQRREEDESKLQALLELEEKVRTEQSRRLQDKQQAPARFQETQIKNLLDAVADSDDEASEYFVPNLKVHQATIKRLATEIYVGSAALRSHIDGQAEAWRMAVQHFNSLKRPAGGLKQGVTKLKSSLGGLKHRTSFDSNAIKGKSADQVRQKDWKKARSGTLQDKVNFGRHIIDLDSLIPEDFKERR